MLVEQLGVANLDGLRRVKAISAADMLELYPAQKYLLPADADYLHKVVMPPGCMLIRENAQWYEIKFRPGQASLECVRSADDSVNCKVSISVSADGPEWSVMERRLNAGKWILVAEDLNGNVKLIGSPEQPLISTTSYNSTARTWSFSWEGFTSHFPYYLPSYSQAVLEGDGVGFDMGFDFGFDS